GPSTPFVAKSAPNSAQDDSLLFEFCELPAVRSECCGQRIFRFGADAEIGVGFCEEDAAFAVEDVCGGEGQTPAWFAVDEGNIDEDGEVVVAVVFGDGVDEAELLCQRVAGVGEHWKR